MDYCKLVQKLTDMNIQKLLKKLQKSNMQSMRDQITPQAPYKLKTSQSVGTVNSIFDQQQRSFVINESNTPQNKFAIHNFSAFSRREEQTHEREQSKNLNESQQSRNRIRVTSVQKSSANKSTEKHVLRPTNTPSFTKFIKPSAPSNNDSACKKLYTENNLQNSQLSMAMPSNKSFQARPMDRKSIYQYPDQGLHVENTDNQPYEEEPCFGDESLSQIGSLSQQLQAEIGSLKLVEASDRGEPQQSYKNPSYGPRENVRHECACNAYSRIQIDSMMQAFQARLSEMHNKILCVEQQNTRIRAEHTEARAQNDRYKLALIQSHNEKQKALDQLKKEQEEKAELQMLLKDVLYKREREKMQSSKENTYRENERSERKATNLQHAQTQSTTQIKPARNSLGWPQPRQSQSKMKVQNLLQKLHIKVDRV